MDSKKETVEGENETGGIREEEFQSYVESGFTFACGAAQERHRRGSPFRPRWPSARNGPSKGELIGQVDGGGWRWVTVSDGR